MYFLNRIRERYILIFYLLIWFTHFNYVYSREIIVVFIKGYSDNYHNGAQRDYKEAVLDAKVKAIEQAGAYIESFSISKNFILQEDIIESKAKGILLPGYRIEDFGYGTDGVYRVLLVGKIKSMIDSYHPDLYVSGIKITSNPLGINVFMNRVKMGITPISILSKNLKGNSDNFFVFKKEGWQTLVKSIHTTSIKDKQIHVILKSNKPNKLTLEDIGRPLKQKLNSIPGKSFKPETRTIIEGKNDTDFYGGILFLAGGIGLSQSAKNEEDRNTGIVFSIIGLGGLLYHFMKEPDQTTFTIHENVKYNQRLKEELNKKNKEIERYNDETHRILNERNYSLLNNWERESKNRGIVQVK